jgi:hypothetical protein
VSPEQARTIVDRFKAGYPKLAAPRMLIYVNRELVDDSTGLQLAGRTENVETLKTDLTPPGSSAAGPLGQNVTVVGKPDAIVQTRASSTSTMNTVMDDNKVKAIRLLCVFNSFSLRSFFLFQCFCVKFSSTFNL